MSLFRLMGTTALQDRLIVRAFSGSKRLEKYRHLDELIPKNVIEGLYSASKQQEKGQVYDLKPFKLKLEKDKLYSWCTCGHSKSQPLCDGTHRIAELVIKLRPVRFKVEETKDYWLCNCKHTSHRPFCDGTHIELREAEKSQEKRPISKQKK